MLQKQTILDKVEVFPDGSLNVYRTTLICEDGKELVRKEDIEKIPRGGTLPKDGSIVSIIASALWSASAVQDGLRDPNYKKGGLYYIKGDDNKPASGGYGGPVNVGSDVAIKDPRASTIKHRGKEQRVNYGQGPRGRSEPIRHKDRG
jgi:hypothetical protein